ncbi:MAG: sugar transferase [Armatimonadetes bacterium]|nr:sugar transferase [Armatimonadota bacterium]
MAITDYTDPASAPQVREQLDRERRATLEQMGIDFGARCAAQPAARESRLYLTVKRALDIVVVLLLLALLAPVFVIIGLSIYMEDRGPIFYRQVRAGRDGRPFTFYKFRSMVVNAEQIQEQLQSKNEASGPIFKMRDDPRVTKTGRWLRRSSLDELPQLINVLLGDVSLVGPRPQLPSEVEQYKPHHRQRLSVQPGLLCLREVSGRSKLTFEEWVELDLLYIQHRGLRMDASIFLRAIKAVLKGDGAY